VLAQSLGKGLRVVIGDGQGICCRRTLVASVRTSGWKLTSGTQSGFTWRSCGATRSRTIPTTEGCALHTEMPQHDVFWWWVDFPFWYSRLRLFLIFPHQYLTHSPFALVFTESIRKAPQECFSKTHLPQSCILTSPVWYCTIHFDGNIGFDKLAFNVAYLPMVIDSFYICHYKID